MVWNKMTILYKVNHVKLNSLILKSLILIFFSIWGARAFAGCDASGAQISPWSGGELKDCTASGNNSCSFDINKTIHSGVWVCTKNLRSTEAQYIKIIYLESKKEVMNLEGTLHGDNLFVVGKATADHSYIKESDEELKNMFTGGNQVFSLSFKYPGSYRMDFCYSYTGTLVYSTVDALRNLAMCHYTYYFNIKPDVSTLSFTITDPDNKTNPQVGLEGGIYHPSYTVKKLIITPEVTNKNAAINNVQSCNYKIPADNQSEVAGDYKSLNIKNKTGSRTEAELNTLLLKPTSTLSLIVECTLGADAYPDYTTSVPETINIQRNQAQPGVPFFTLGNTTAKNQYADWAPGETYNIGVTTENYNTLQPFDSCIINGTTYSYHNGLSFTVNSNALQGNCSNDNYTSCRVTRDYSGSCQIGGDTNSPYHYYPVKDIAIAHPFSITVYPPRITQASDFEGKFTEVLVNNKAVGETNKVRPGETVTVKSRVELKNKTAHGDFPNVVVDTATADSHLTGVECKPDWESHRGNSGCHLNGLEYSRSKSGEWLLQADANLMAETQATIKMIGSNYEGKIYSGSYNLAEETITIRPLVKLDAQLLPKLEALKDKVYHYGRQFTVSADYSLKGRNEPDILNKLNESYRGQLTTLQVSLDKDLSGGDQAKATLKVNNQSVTSNPQWNGHEQAQFMAAGRGAALAHGELSKLDIPLNVTRRSDKTEPFFTKVRVGGRYEGNNVDIADPILPEQAFTLELGPDLYPADQAFQMTVNKGIALRLSPGQTDSVMLVVDFNSRLGAEKLATPEGIQDTAMQITLPKGLQRSTQGGEKGKMTFICPDRPDCNSELKGDWDGKTQRNILQPKFLLKPTGHYSLRIPLVLENKDVPSSPVELTLSQAESIDQDTRARIVAWQSTVTELKPVEQIAHQELSIFPLEYKEQTIEPDNKMNITVQVKNAQPQDTVTLQAGSTAIAMQYQYNQGDVALFTSKTPQPMPTTAEYRLLAQVNDSSDMPLVVPQLGDPRQLNCTWEDGSPVHCDFRWHASLPFVSGSMLLSYQTLDETDKQLTASGKGGIMMMDKETREKLHERLEYMQPDGDWGSVKVFHFADSKPQDRTSLPQPVAELQTEHIEQQSLFETGKVLPAEGVIHLQF